MFRTVATLCLALPALIVSAQERVNVSQFSQNDLSRWKEKEFNGATDYQIIRQQDQFVLKATSRQSASILALEEKVDLLKTPYINWSWKIENQMSPLNERIKSGDDYSARLYVVIGSSWAIWNTRTLNYVWSSNQPKGSNWNNAYAGEKAKMMAVRGESDALNMWFSEKRNLYQDLIQLLGDKGSDEENLDAYRYIDAIAIMTDSDDSKQQATAYYGDIIFTDN